MGIEKAEIKFISAYYVAFIKVFCDKYIA